MTNFLSRNTKIYIQALIACLFLVGIPLIWLSPDEINPDSHQYISIADYYLYSSNTDIRDALTVGPVIPAILAIIKFSIIKFATWGPDANIVLLKALAFICYVVIFASAYKLIAEFIDERKTSIALIFLLVFLTMRMDSLSLNGELASVAMISVLMVLFRKNDKNLSNLLSISIFSVLVIYTKLQAAPILLLLILSESRSKTEFIKTSCYIVGALLIAETFLYANGAGIIRNLASLYNYVSQEAPSPANTLPGAGHAYNIIKEYSYHIEWILQNLALNFPLLFFVIFALAFENKKPNSNYFSSWKIWICVTIFVIALPHRRFEHYLILTIPFIIRFAGPAIFSIKGKQLNLKNEYFICSFLLLLIFIKAFSALPDLNKLRESGAGAFPKSLFGNEVDDVRDIVKNEPGKIFIHGWDYRLNSYLDVYSSKMELPMLKVGAINEREYLNNLISNDFDYVIDIINYTGYAREWEYSLSNQNIFGAVVAQYYDLVYQKGGLQLYKKKPEASLIYR